MATLIDYDDLVLAFGWVSAAGPFENAAYVSREIGTIYWATDTDSLEEELPEDVEDESQYATVPHKHDLDLGKDLVFRFVREYVPDAYNEVRDFFARRGAYGKFKDFLERSGKLEAWYAYEERATDEALSEWASENGFQIARKPRAES